MNRSTTHLMIINTLGTLGYLSGILQWAWALIILSYPIITSNTSFLFPKPTRHTVIASSDFGTFTPLVMAIAAVVTVLILLATIVTLARLPKTIGRAGARSTQTVAKVVLPTVTHHKVIPKKRYVTLSYRIIAGLKYSLTVLPFALLLFAPLIETLPMRIILTVGLFAAGFTLSYFSLQALLVELLHVDKKKVW